MCDPAEIITILFRWFLAPLATALAGGFVGHWLATRREVAARTAILEREADVRRRAFRRHVLRFRYAVERGGNSEAWSIYDDGAPALLAEAALVEGDFTDRAEFDRLVIRAGHWERDKAEAEASSGERKLTLREFLRDRIYDLAEFAKTK